MSARIAVLASGSGTLLQAVLDSPLGHQVVIVGTDVPGAPALDRARAAGIPTVTVAVGEYPNRGAWDTALLAALQPARPDWIVSAGFMRIIGPQVLNAFPERIINTHPALLPAFPGAHGVRDALAYGVKVTGCTVHYVDAGVDTGRIIAQRAVPVETGDDEATLHERIKVVERELLVQTLTELIGAPA
jgi:phosphoribosylglycinamide formyltransferase-1